MELSEKLKGLIEKSLSEKSFSGLLVADALNKVYPDVFALETERDNWRKEAMKLENEVLGLTGL